MKPAALVVTLIAALGATQADDAWLSWSASRAQGIGKGCELPIEKAG